MTSPQAAASTTAAPDEPVLTPLQQSLAAYDFTGVSQKNFEMACLLLDAERYTYEGREDYLLLDAKDWYYVGRIAYEVGYFTNQFYTKLSELLEGICLKQASGEEIRIRKCASSSSLSNEGRTFKQPQARLLAGQEQQQWQTVPNYIDEARLRRYEHIATRFLELLRSCDDPTGQSPLTP